MRKAAPIPFFPAVINLNWHCSYDGAFHWGQWRSKWRAVSTAVALPLQAPSPAASLYKMSKAS
jgi:hypothetical protein